MGTICDPCDVFVCAKDVPECANFLNIGDTISLTGEVTIYVQKFINGTPIQEAQAFVQTGYGDILLDLNDPRPEWFNSHDGQYKVWVTDKGALPTDRLTLSSEGTSALIWAFTFFKSNANFGTITIEAV